MNDELDNPEVRAKLAQLRREGEIKRQVQDALTTPESWFDKMRTAGLEPIAEGADGHDVTPLVNDAFGRGPTSPFYAPEFRPPWAPEWRPAPPDERSDA